MSNGPDAITLPAWIMPSLLVAVMAFLTMWVRTTSAEEAAQLDQSHQTIARERFGKIENDLQQHELSIQLINQRLGGVEASIKAAAGQSSANHELLIRISTKLEVVPPMRGTPNGK